MKEMNETYIFSFTALSSPVADFTRSAQMLVEADYDLNKLNRNDVGKEKERTNQRHFQEMKMRFKNLTQEEIDVLATGDLNDKKMICFLAVCKSYNFIFEFVVEVIREKVLLYDYEIKELDYNSFTNRKIYDHPEYEKLSELTQKKIKQVLFRILEQVGVIDSTKSKNIQHLLLSPKLIRVICNDNWEFLRIFLKPDREIMEYSHGN